MLSEITKDMTIGDIVDADKRVVPFFLEMGMHCLGCPSARGESVEQACLVHSIDPDEFIQKVNEYLKNAE